MNVPEQLRILSIFHYIVGGLHALFGCFGLIHFSLGVAMLLSPSSWDNTGEPMPAVFPWIFVIFGGGFVLFGLALGTATALSGYFISRRKRRMYSIIVGAINCLMFPFGIALGVFDLVLLSRDSVLAEYNAAVASKKEA